LRKNGGKKEKKRKNGGRRKRSWRKRNGDAGIKWFFFKKSFFQILFEN
jgi:hypothetical protein